MSAPIRIEQGRAIDANAAENARIAVVGNPANTNCMIAATMAARSPAGTVLIASFTRSVRFL